ncbi:MAG: VCBS repeat-containing protein [Betaproteobacteria bacterium]|nr:VCBS repeat-containing protein [Betaproteobacteria bacterium]
MVAASRGFAAIVLAMACATGAEVVQAQTITTVAGGIGEGGTATEVDLGYPSSIAKDAAGNLYIAGQQNLVRKVGASGTITTVAGNVLDYSRYAFSGDGGPATAANFALPVAIALDSAGDLYIADRYNYRVRKVDANGIVSTVAGNGSATHGGDGGPAMQAGIAPIGLAFDAAGNLYIADTDNHRIRRVGTNGIITTVAGNGVAASSGDGGAATAASIGKPCGIALDASGNLFIADEQFHVIRRVSTGGTITTVAGTGSPSFGGDGGPAAAAALDAPCGLAFDTAGNLYISDKNNFRVRRMSPDGVIHAFAGNGPYLFGYTEDGIPATQTVLSRPHAVATDAAGNVYIDTPETERIRKVDPSGIISTVAGIGPVGYGGFVGDGGPATRSTLRHPARIAVDVAGNLYIPDSDDARVRKVSAGGTITTTAGIGRYGGGALGDGGPAVSERLRNPQAVATDATGNLFIVDSLDHRIRKVSASGIITTVAGNGSFGFSGDGGAATEAELNSPSDVAVDATGNLFIADRHNGRIRRVNTSGIISTIAGNGSGLASGDGGPATAAGLDPIAICLDASDNLYVADFGNNRVRKISAAGVITTVAGNGAPGNEGDGGPATAASFRNPIDVAVDAAGNLYVADFNNARIRKVGATGIVSTVVGAAPAGFAGDGGPALAASMGRPEGVAVDAAGNLYISDTENRRVRKVDFSTRRDPTFPDFNADGKPDILWQNIASGETYIWHMDGPVPISGAPLATFGPSWKVQGIADFNGDGHMDIVLRDATSGAYVLWYLANGVYQSDAVLFTLPQEWVIQGSRTSTPTESPTSS